MKWKTGSKDQCAITALSILFEVPVDQIRSKALKLGMKLENGMTFSVFKKLWKELGGSSEEVWGRDWCSLYGSDHPDLSGQGILYIQIKNSVEKEQHAVAFKDHKIYEVNGIFRFKNNKKLWCRVFNL